MFSKKPKLPTVSREQSLAMRPLRLTDEPMQVDAAGNGKLAVPVRPTRLATWLAARMPPRNKTFEFDPVGVFLWEHVDGKTSVEQLIRKIGKHYSLELRQAEASTTAFLKTLMQKGLVGMTATKAPSSPDADDSERKKDNKTRR